MSSTKTHTLIIGAGPYGLSLANYLSHYRKPFVIAGKPMELWRRHTFDSMRLRSDTATSEIGHPEDGFSFERFRMETGLSLSDTKGQLPVSVFRDYINWCESRFRFDIREQYVTHLQRQSSGLYAATLDDGKIIRSQQVILATGIAHHLHIPNNLQQAKRIIHSYDVQTIQSLQDRRVLVVGAGQSAAESIAVLQNNRNRVDWYTRSDPIFFSEPLNLPKWVFNQIVRLPRLFRALPPQLLDSTLGLFSATTITPNFENMLDQHQRFTRCPDLSAYDAIIAATGYRYHLRDLPFMDGALRQKIRQYRNLPVVSPRFESSVPGLYFLGAMTEPFFGPSMKFMIGARYSAAVVSRALA